MCKKLKAKRKKNKVLRMKLKRYLKKINFFNNEENIYKAIKLFKSFRQLIRKDTNIISKNKAIRKIKGLQFKLKTSLRFII